MQIRRPSLQSCRIRALTLPMTFFFVASGLFPADKTGQKSKISVRSRQHSPKHIPWRGMPCWHVSPSHLHCGVEKKKTSRFFYHRGNRASTRRTSKSDLARRSSTPSTHLISSPHPPPPPRIHLYLPRSWRLHARPRRVARGRTSSHRRRPPVAGETLRRAAVAGRGHASSAGGHLSGPPAHGTAAAVGLCLRGCRHCNKIKNWWRGR